MGEEAPAVPNQEIVLDNRTRHRFAPIPASVCQFVYAELAADRSVPDGRELEGAVQRQIYGLVYRQMHSLVRRQQQDFERLVQEAATRALWALPSFDCSSKVSTWTWTICWRTVREHSRSVKAIALALGRLAGLVASQPQAIPDPGATVEQRQRAERLQQALDSLSLVQRTVVILYYFEDLSMEEISQVLSTKSQPIPPKTIQSRLNSARCRLRELLANDPSFGEEQMS